VNKFTGIFAIGIFVFCSSLASNELIDRYKHRHSDLVEADVDSIINLLADPDSVVRTEAAFLLGTAFEKGFSSAQRAIPTLKEMLRSDPCLMPKGGAVVALSFSGDPEVAGLLLGLAEDDSVPPLLRSTALSGLRRMQAEGTEAVDIAWRNVRSSNPSLAWESLKTVVQQTDRESLKRLVQLYIDFHEHPDTSLLKAPPIGSRDNFSSAYQELSWRLSQLNAVARLAPDLIEPLLHHANPKFRLDAAKGFASEHDTTGVSVLLDILENSDNWQYRVQAAFSFFDLGPGLAGQQREDVVDALRKALDDSYAGEARPGVLYRPVARMAYSVLKYMGVEVQKPEDIDLY
jgi:HEAT repeat protein